MAAYCRVSTDKSDQINSFESQQRYFRQYIESQPDWSLYAVYADEGITGTSTEKRAAFNRMIRDARAGCFDLIITKEISRFARNTLDSIYYTRELKRMGVGVLFLNDHMNTLEEDSELLLAIKATMAQEESRATSARVKWGQTRRMEQGVVFGRSLLGYDVRDGQMTVNPAGAELVRLIFHKCVHERKGAATIARELQQAGWKTYTGGTIWHSGVIVKILRNEKYCGDLKQKKTITPDYLSHQKKRNCGQEPFVCLRDHHEPVVSRELWEAAQQELARRAIHSRKEAGHGNSHPLSGKIWCGLCGRPFVARSRRREDGSRYRVWRCATAVSEGRLHTGPDGQTVGCSIGYQLREETALAMVQRSVEQLGLDVDALAADVLRIVRAGLVRVQQRRRASVAMLKRELEQLHAKKTNGLDAFLAGSLSEHDMQHMNGVYDQRMEALAAQIAEAEQMNEPDWESERLQSDLRSGVEELVCGKVHADAFLAGLLERICAYPDRRIEVQLRQLPDRWSYTLNPRGGIR